MVKFKFLKEYEIKASTKLLYPYISTPEGLQNWFAEKASLSPEQTYSFIWENTDHPAKLVLQKANKFVRFEFLPTKEGDEEDPDFIEFKLETSDVTQSVYLSITDYSKNTNEHELHELWDDLVESLKDTVSGQG